MAQSAGLVWVRLCTCHRTKFDMKKEIIFLSKSDLFYLLIVGVE